MHPLTHPPTNIEHLAIKMALGATHRKHFDRKLFGIFVRLLLVEYYVYPARALEHVYLQEKER